jgi:hypothetical protein
VIVRDRSCEERDLDICRIFGTSEETLKEGG